MAKVTIHDIAKVLGVSASTVSRALSDHPKISKQTKEKVFQVARDLGYQSGLQASPSVRRNIVALVIPNQESSFMRETVRLLHQYMEPDGVQLLTFHTYESTAAEKRVVQELQSLNPAVVLVALANESSNAQHFAPLAAQGIPLSFFYRVDYAFAAPRVVIDNYEAAYKATKHLVDSGYRRIAHLAGPPSSSLYSEIVSGYKAALDDAGIEFRPDFLIHSDLTTGDAKECMNRLYGPGTQPNAIFASSNHAALEAIKYLRHSGIRVPNQVGVVSYGYNPAGAFFIPSISTIEQPAHDIAEDIVGLLRRLLKGESIGGQTVVKAAKLIVRSSSLPS